MMLESLKILPAQVSAGHVCNHPHPPKQDDDEAQDDDVRILPSASRTFPRPSNMVGARGLEPRASSGLTVYFFAGTLTLRPRHRRAWATPTFSTSTGHNHASIRRLFIRP